jgi:hypothetical protein
MHKEQRFLELFMFSQDDYIVRWGVKTVKSCRRTPAFRRTMQSPSHFLFTTPIGPDRVRSPPPLPWIRVATFRAIRLYYHIH